MAIVVREWIKQTVMMHKPRKHRNAGTGTEITKRTQASLVAIPSPRVYLVPRPFPPLVFDRLQTEGKAWEKESRAWRQVDMRGGIVIHKPFIDQLESSE